ncbi:Maf family nucleotide pyrophosphatase [Flavobacteriaceae bacterium]|nr:Maf family nucleotide pyrophosphatase [Flavobacteriaceae bacterium]
MEKIKMDTKGYVIILASASPRRQLFFKEMKIPFLKKVIPIEESFPSNLSGSAIAEHIVAQKANAFKDTIKVNEIIITADTIVWHQNKCLGKPISIQNAEEILMSLSDDTHQVITAVGFLLKETWECINVVSEVTFGPVSKKAIQEYIATGSPMDKAGAYGIQDSFGTLHIDSISGSYTNIIGLPVTHVYKKLQEIIKNNHLKKSS